MGFNSGFKGLNCKAMLNKQEMGILSVILSLCDCCGHLDPLHTLITASDVSGAHR